MTPGRVAAQVGHAASQLALKAPLQAPKEYKEWIGTIGFGTKLVLQSPNPDNFKDTFELDYSLSSSIKSKFVTGLVTDPEYHVIDGNAKLIVPNVSTVLWAFGKRDDLMKAFFDKFELYHA